MTAPSTGDVPRIAVVDHGAGNLVSISQGLQRAGAAAEVVTEPSRLDRFDGVVLPGVGATASVMEGIRRAGFEGPLRDLDVPLLGICVGMQVLFERSEEDGATGLGLLPGEVRRLADAPRLPHIGWNDVSLLRPDPLLAGIGDEPLFYFVHSYAPVPATDDVIIATAEYGSTCCAAVRSGKVAGVQFHPERSGSAGLGILANFVTRCREAADAA